MATTEQNGKFLKGITVTLGILVSIQGLWAVYTQSNRFTAADGEKLYAQMDALGAKHTETTLDLVQRIADIHREMPKEVPPAWFLNRVDRLETHLERLQASYEQHERDYHYHPTR